MPAFRTCELTGGNIRYHFFAAKEQHASGFHKWIDQHKLKREKRKLYGLNGQQVQPKNEGKQQT